MTALHETITTAYIQGDEIDQARRTLRTATTIRGSHTKAKKAIDDAGRQLGVIRFDPLTRGS